MNVCLCVDEGERRGHGDVGMMSAQNISCMAIQCIKKSNRTLTFAERCIFSVCLLQMFYLFSLQKLQNL